MLIQVIDVTLRDGGNLTNFHFLMDHLDRILTLLDSSGIEYIEIGYRNGAIRPDASCGEAGLCAQKYLEFCQARIQHANIAVMAHASNIGEADVIELKKYGVSLLRVCVQHGRLAEAFPVICMAKQHGLQVSINVIHASYYTIEALDALVATLLPYQPDMIYFADSNGSLLPRQITEIYQRMLAQYAITFGFHAHDNLGLAQANTLAAIDAGVCYVDSSLAGMGKGLGNLRSEFFIAYLQALKIKKYHLPTVVEAANFVCQQYQRVNSVLDYDEFLRGILDLSTADLKRFKENG